MNTYSQINSPPVEMIDIEKHFSGARVMVMNNGRNVGTYKIDEVSKDDLPDGRMPRNSEEVQ